MSNISIDLMAPRYEVVNLYPGSEDWETIGAVITLPDTRYKYADDILCDWGYFDCYPTVYRKLQWWEKREVSEMPLYLKPTEQGKLSGVTHPVKVVSWFADNKECFSCEEFPGAPMYTEDYVPATLAEYQSYLNSKQ